MKFTKIVATVNASTCTPELLLALYKNGMDGGQFGFQSANAVIFFIVIVAFSIIQMKITGKKEEQL